MAAHRSPYSRCIQLCRKLPKIVEPWMLFKSMRDHFPQSTLIPDNDKCSGAAESVFISATFDTARREMLYACELV